MAQNTCTISFHSFSNKAHLYPLGPCLCAAISTSKYNLSYRCLQKNVGPMRVLSMGGSAAVVALLAYFAF